MANQQINQYPIERTNLGDDDFFDIDYFDGTNYQTAKIRGSVIKTSAGIGLYAQISDSNEIRNTTTETSLFDGASGVGSLMVPANGFQVGDSFHVKMGGTIGAGGSGDANIRIKTGSVILADSGTLALPSMTNRIFEIEMDFTIRQIGAPGVAEIITHGEINYVQNAGGGSWEGENFISVNNSTFDTIT